jgi:hypothetical protein
LQHFPELQSDGETFGHADLTEPKENYGYRTRPDSVFRATLRRRYPISAGPKHEGVVHTSARLEFDRPVTSPAPRHTMPPRIKLSCGRAGDIAASHFAP